MANSTTKLGLGGGPRGVLQLVLCTGAFTTGVLSGAAATQQGIDGSPRAVVPPDIYSSGMLAPPTMAGTGAVVPAQEVDASGAFDGPDLSTPLQTGVGLSSQGVSATGAFSLNLSVSADGSGIVTAVIVASGDFAPSDLEITQVGAGVSVQGVLSSGGLVEWDGGTIEATSLGTGALVDIPDALGTGTFVSDGLDIPVQVGTGVSVPPQVVDASGAFDPGDLATPVFAGTGASDPAGVVSAQGAFAGGSLDVTADGNGTASQPQIVDANGSFVAGDLQASADGSGTVTGILGIGVFTKDLSVVSLAAGLAEPPPAFDLGWEDDDVAWGGLELSSKDAAPLALRGTEFYIVGQATDSSLALYLERRAIVYMPGQEVIGLGVYPEIEGPDGAAIQISLGGHKSPDGAIDWEGPYDFILGESSYVDFAVSGKYLAIKFESSGIGPWTLQAYTIDYELLGRA